MNSLLNLSKTSTLAVLLTVAAFFKSANCCQAQTGANAFYNPPASLSGKTVIIPTGTCFEGRIGSTIGSSVSRQGERFVIEMTNPALANGTDVIIPAGSLIYGEVVSAVPSGKVPHDKHHKPFGKLRVQIMGLKMPDGTTFPMIASLVGEEDLSGRGENPNLGGGMAYAGSANSFEAVKPGRVFAKRSRSGIPHVVTKQELLKDPIYGKDTGGRFARNAQYAIRSLVKKKRNFVIYQGSPLTVRLDAPFKMTVGVARSAGAAFEAPQPPEGDDLGGHRRFSPYAQPEADDNANGSNDGAPPAKNGAGGSSGGAPAGIIPPAVNNAATPGSTSTAPQAPPQPPLPFQVPAKGAGGRGNSADSDF